MKKFVDYKVELLDTSVDGIREEYFDLWKASFGDRPKCCDGWYDWLNFNGPYGNNNSYVIRDSETNKMICGYGLLPMIINYNNKDYEGRLCHNGMSHPDFGKRGLFTAIGRGALSDDKKKGAMITFGIPNINAIRGHMKVGWQRLPNLAFYEKSGFEKKDIDFEYRIINEFDNSFDEKLDSFHKKYNFYFKKTHKFLNWRYVNHPYNNYTCFVLGDDISSFTGYAVVNLYEKKLHILDYAYDTNKDLNKLLHIIENHAISQPANLINLWKLDVPNKEDLVFETNDYFKTTDDYNRLILHSDIDFPNDISDWHVVLGDNDVY